MVVLLAVNLAVGSVSIPLRDVVSIIMGHEAARPSWQFIIMESRLPQAITAMLCGGSLAVSGLMLQTAFKNPLAGPSIFGVNSGAGVGVALVMLGMGGSLSVGSVSITGFMAVLAAAFVGAMAVMGLIFLFSTMVHNNVMLLIVGIMIGYIANSVVALLKLLCHGRGRQVLYGMGHGLFWRRADESDSFVRLIVRIGNGGGFAVSETPQCPALRRTLC